MPTPAIFGLSALMSLISSIVVATLYVWPRLRLMDRNQAAVPLVIPHLFLRFVGLGFLVPGVVTSALPSGFAVPAACGDLGAGILAIVAAVGLAKRAAWAIPAVWVFNIWGAADLLLAIYEGQRTGLAPGALGATFFIPTALVPPLLVTHGLIFLLLVRGKS